MRKAEKLIYRLLSFISCLIVLALVLAAGGQAIAVGEAASPSPKHDPAPASQAASAGTSKAAEPKLDFLGTTSRDEPKTEEPKEAPLFITALSFIFKFALVLGLAYGTIYALKKFSGVRGPVGSARRFVRVLENASLGANRGLHVVEVGSRKFLVASTPSAVSLITELQDTDLPEAPALDAPVSFKDQLSGFLGNKPDSTNAAKSVALSLRETSTFFHDKGLELGQLRRRLRGVDNV